MNEKESFFIALTARPVTPQQDPHAGPAQNPAAKLPQPGCC